jgi:hypothetical protein
VSKRNLLVSVSGGRSSHYMAKHIREHPDYAECNILFVFANTGKERTETLDFVHECDVRWQLGIVWVEAKVHHGERKGSGYTLVNYATASRRGEPFEEMIRKYGIPNQSFPHCTRELKLNPIHAYAEKHFNDEPYITAIGIRVDEARRIRMAPDKCYPLVEWGVNVERVRRWWQQQPFDLQLRDYEGNCDLCWKKSIRKLMTLVNERPRDTRWWLQMEEWYSGLKLVSRAHSETANKPQFFGRKAMSMVELLKQAKQPFTPVTDAFWQEQRTEALDTEEACACMLQDYDGEAA